MTATDRLRALLDERGVEYETDDHMGFSETRWGGDGAFQLAPGAALVMRVTPEQAVEATLGRVTCRVTSAIILHDPDGYETTLDCGHIVHMPPEDFDYCPNCGRRVVDGR